MGKLLRFLVRGLKHPLFNFLNNYRIASVYDYAIFGKA